jgi:hypothetical protein
MIQRKLLLPLLAALLATSAPLARAEGSGGKDLAVLQNTVVNLLEAMVQQGLISKAAADKLVADAQQKAEAAVAADEPKAGDVRVTYVPRVVQDQITAEVKKDVQAGVVADVKKAAAEEGWGVPAALPAWVRNSRWSGDIRVRGESTTYADGNAEFAYPDFQRVNAAGGIGKAGDSAFLNTTTDQVRYQLRMGLGAQFDLADNALAGIRIGTGNQLNPVTRNQVLGNDQRTFPLLLEEAYLRLSTPSNWQNHQVLFWAGRTPNPFQSTELVWDTDVRFNGFSVQYAWNNPSVPGEPRRARGLFGTLGAFPIQEIELSGQDKWLVAGQLGYEFDVRTDLRLSLAGAYYDFRQVTGERNAPDSELRDFTAPDYLQKGNTLFDIRNDTDAATNLFALAADYNLINLNAGISWTLAPDLVVDAMADYVSNVGYDEQDILARTGVLVPERADGYRFEVRLGNADVARPLAWRVFLAYHYAERDAVLDAFTESDLHRGGTDSEGYIIGGDLGITRNTWARLRFLSADEIDGAALGVDVLQIDLNGKF